MRSHSKEQHLDRKLNKVRWLNGRASDYESGGSRFDPWVDRVAYLFGGGDIGDQGYGSFSFCTTYLDKELPNGIKHRNSERGNQGSDERDHDPRVAREPSPDVMDLDSLFVRQPQSRGIFASLFAQDEPMHAVPCHDSVPDQDEVDVGKAGQDLGVCRLGRDFTDLAIFPEDAVECLL